MAFWKRFPRPRTDIADFKPILDSWSISKRFHEWTAGASDEEIETLQRRVGRCIPPTLIALYQMSNGIGLLGGNLNTWPIEGTDERELSILECFHLMSSGEWKLPKELLLFGDNGSDSIYGIWLPLEQRNFDTAPVIEIGECSTECMTVAGTDVCTFLKIHTAYYSMLEEAGARALDALGVPPGIRTNDPDDRTFECLRDWADPTRVASPSKPYDDPVSESDLRTLFGGD